MHTLVVRASEGAWTSAMSAAVLQLWPQRLQRWKWVIFRDP